MFDLVLQMKKPLTTATYIAAAKQAGLSDSTIAGKLGISVEDLQAVWNDIFQSASACIESGYAGLVDQFTTLAHQYQLVGESLKAVATAVGELATVEEIAMLVPVDLHIGPLTIAKKLSKHFIILRRYTPPSPEKTLEQSIEGN